MRAAKILFLLVRCYPRSFRNEFGAEIKQDLEAECAKRGNFSNLCRIAFDLSLSALTEQWIERKQIMRTTKTSTYLLVAALLANAASFGAMQIPLVAVGLVYLGSFLLLARLPIEWTRPANHWWRIAGVGFLLAIAYGIFLPAWAKVSNEFGAPRLIPILVIAPFLLTIALGILKGLLALIARPPARPA